MKKYFILFCFLGFSLFLEGVPTYTLKECIEFALDANVSILNARDDLEIAEAKIIQARSEVLPHIAAHGSYSRFEEDPYEKNTLDYYNVRLSANQLIYSGGEVVTALKAAKQSRVYYGYGFEGTSSEIIRDVIKQFYGVLYTRSVVEVREESLKQLNDLLDDSIERVATGTASQFDLLRAKVSVSNEKPLLITASNDYALAVASFKRTLNMDDEIFDITGSLSNYPAIKTDLTDLNGKCLQNRPEILEMESLLVLKEYDRDAAGSDWWPTISLNFNYNGANGIDYGFGGGGEWDWNWDAGVVAKWDLWNGNMTYGMVKEKNLEVRKQEQAYEDFQKTALLQVKIAYLDMNAAKKAIDSAFDGLEFAVEAQNIASKRYKIGLGTYLEFTDANLSLSTSRLTLLTVVYAYYRAIADLEYAVGVELFPK
ncbi:MAG: TolC family protein [Kiritimatiellae bacterium]|jgi:outer membrane protein|nr:TolC family protein [Kiritimatiellia bacterium]